MPKRPENRICLSCGKTFKGKGHRCPQCRPTSDIDRGEHRNAKYYTSAEWRKIRAEVLTSHGIPKDIWHLYDVDHTPQYNPEVESDHRKYTLTPLLHGEHSRKTANEISRDNGRFSKQGERGEKSLQGTARNRVGQFPSHSVSKKVRGS